MIKVNGISKSYGHKRVLDNISLSIPASSLTGIVGENGAGKTTLLKIITGEIHATGGSVNITGSMGYCPQQPLVFNTLTVRENFDYFGSGYGITRNNTEWISIRNMHMEEFGLTQYAHQRVDLLSGGTKQKLNLSISLLHDPDICILDEPYGGFDWSTYQHFWEVILQLRAKGKTVLIITHMLNDLGHFDKVYSLKAGNIHEMA